MRGRAWRLLNSSPTSKRGQTLTKKLKLLALARPFVQILRYVPLSSTHPIVLYLILPTPSAWYLTSRASCNAVRDAPLSVTAVKYARSGTGVVNTKNSATICAILWKVSCEIINGHILASAEDSGYFQDSSAYLGLIFDCLHMRFQGMPGYRRSVLIYTRGIALRRIVLQGPAYIRLYWIITLTRHA